jgi:predicted secreted hydrolase
MARHDRGVVRGIAGGAGWWLLAACLPCAAWGAQLRLGAVLGETDTAGFARAEAPIEFDFPADHGAHPDFRSEWWYVTASLEGPDGRRFGVQFTLFRQALAAEPAVGGPWDARQIYLGHLAVTDVAGGRHVHAERLSRGHPRLAGVTATPLRAAVDGWRLEGQGAGLERLTLDAATTEMSVTLSMDAVKPIVLQGDRGLSAKGPDQASYYYSLPRLAVAGRLQLDGEAHRVTGTAWLDREWSTSVLSAGQRGWDWFGLQLDDGTELMAFQLRRDDGVRDPYDQGLWVDADGDAVQLRTQDFMLTPMRRWRDDQGVAWPVAWRISLMTPSGPRELTVEAALEDQRMETLFTYWEGLVTVRDEAGDDIGTGYMELTGYE